MRYLLLTAGLLCCLQGFPQLFPPADYPRDYFRDPLAVPMSLAANFGELRPNHYHMGLDIRTQHRENLPVYAAADGYVARVSVEPGGFGQAIYIHHPNGYSTVYGHLNQFFPGLAAYVHKEQYRRQSWQVNLEVPPTLFPVKKGELIAYSGNTGGSQGPHLHFEIRRTAGDVNLNPLLFGLPVPDQTAPGITRLAWYDRNQGIYEQSPHFVAVQKSGLVITVPTTRISFALQAFDTQSGSANPNGIFEADLTFDGQPVIGFQMDGISYDNTRNINAHIDYKTRNLGGPFLQHLSFLPGYPFPSIYMASAGRVNDLPRFVDPAAPVAGGVRPANGVLDLGDGRPHEVVIRVRDTNGNTTSVVFTVQYQATAGDAVAASAGAVAARGGAATTDSAGMLQKKFYVGMVDGLETSGCAFFLSEKSLYDSVAIAATASGYPGSGHTLPGGISHSYMIGGPWIPLLDPVLVRIRDERSPAPDSIASGGLTSSATDRIVMVCVNGGAKDVQRVEWHEGWASARFHEFGSFQLVDDRTPPVVTPLGPLQGANLSKASRIAFSVKDDLGAVRNFRAELDGAWLCFTNDKGLAYIYKFDEHCPAGRHTLKVSVEDAAGNSTVRAYDFTR